MEVEGVEAGAQVAALFFVPDEGRAVVAEVAGEGGHVAGGVGEAEDVVADEGAGGGGAEGVVVVGGGNDGELLYDVPVHSCVPCIFCLATKSNAMELSAYVSQ